MAISQTPAFSPGRSFFLADTADIPSESDAKVFTSGVGHSQWFWAEIPVGAVSSTDPNYLIIWSPTDNFSSAAIAPILAAGESLSKDAAEPLAWLNRSIQGVPPRSKANSLETPITNLSPALALKLVPANERPVNVGGCSITPVGQKFLFQFSVDAQNTEAAWVETSHDQLDWQRISSYLRQPPYMLTVPSERISARGSYIRATAKDFLGNTGSCEPVFVSRAAH
jgi:hypothetical protein